MAKKNSTDVSESFVEPCLVLVDHNVLPAFNKTVENWFQVYCYNENEFPVQGFVEKKMLKLQSIALQNFHREAS